MRGIQAFFPPARKKQAVSDNPSRLLLERWLDRKKRSFDLILTEDILDEYKEVLNRLRVRAASEIHFEVDLVEKIPFPTGAKGPRRK
jgi:hypothetical protein